MIADAREGEAPAEPGVQGSGFRVQEDDALANQDRSELVNDHPVRACSHNETVAGNGHPAVANAADATDCQDEVSGELENRRREFLAALHDDAAPVQPPFTDAGGMLLDSSEMETTNGHASATSLLDQPIAASARPMSRKERRARQRLLERKLRKAK